MANRKHVRIALTEEDDLNFRKAKEIAENATGVSMSDSMFALSVIRKHIATRITD